MNPSDPLLELQLMLWQFEISPEKALQMFHDAGLISDHCIQLKDIAHADIPKCIAHIYREHDVGS